MCRWQEHPTTRIWWVKTSPMPMLMTESVQCQNDKEGVINLQVKNVLEASANLDDRTKVIAEYWADFPGSNLPPGACTCATCTHGSMCSKQSHRSSGNCRAGHWSQFTEYVSLRDNNNIDKVSNTGQKHI